MKSDRLNDAIGEVRDDYISDADAVPAKAGKTWLRWGALAASVCLIVGGLYAVTRQPVKTDDPTPIETVEQPTEQETSVEQPVEAEKPNGGIDIPAIELPEPQQGAAMDMIGLVVYQGGIYSQAQMFSYEDTEKLIGLVGDYIGHCEGKIDEWSSQEEYEHELAGNMYGDIYTVKGYDPSFRICIKSSYTTESGERKTWIEFLERLNGITIYTGSDLFEDRLNIKGRVTSIQWQAHEDWDWNRGNIQDAELDETVWDAFLDAADSAEFFNAWNPDKDFYPDHPKSSIYDNPNQAHLILNMEDGTTVWLRLIEGGYVGYHGIGWWYFVQLPAEVFDPVFDACGGTHLTEWDVEK